MLNNPLNFDLPKEHSSIIKVIGVGGGGSNAVNYMYEQGITGVDFIVCNTDAQALDKSPVPIKIQLGSTLTEGRGAGSIPEVGRNAAIESLEEVKAYLSKNTNMVFITAGMGGGTGTGAAPVIARAAKEMGILTVGIVTIPFLFEGRKRSVQADWGIKEIRESVDTLLVIRNDKLRELYGNLTLKQAFSHADEVLCTAAKGIAEVITLTGRVNVDMNDVKTVMKDSGVAIMGSGRASGEGRARRAVSIALESPLLNDNDIQGANFILLNITYGNDELLMDEITEITDYIQAQAGHEAEVIWGYGQDDTLGDDVCITVIATGFTAKTVEAGLLRQEPEQKKVWLENQTAREVVKKVESPTQPLDVVEQKPEDPFIKTVDTPQEVELDIPTASTPVSLFHTEQPQVTNTLRIKEDKTDDANTRIVHSLDESTVNDILAKSNQAPATDSLKMEVQPAETATDRPSRSEVIARQKEREMRIREHTIKLKTPTGLNDLESEPAYVRKKVVLTSTPASHESQVSRLSLNETTDENGQRKAELRTDNPFLHDQAD